MQKTGTMKKTQKKRTKKKYNKNHFEHIAWEQEEYVCGIDEVGRGALAGPVVVSAVILPLKTSYRMLKDSKILTKEQREKACKWITKKCIYSTAIASHNTIDKINIYQATVQMTKKALIQVLSKSQIPIEKMKFILTDNVPLTLTTSYIPDHIEFHHFPLGEQISTSIAAASIVAKVTRDKLMDYAQPLFPSFQFNKHKGYGTKDHQNSLKDHGPTILHRTSFLSNIQSGTDNYEEQSSLF